MKNNILSIQSQVASGFVGNNVAEFAIQLHGVNVVALPTVILSTHTDHDIFYGEDIAPHLFQNLIKGIKSIPIYKDIQCVISGYINSKEIIDITSKFINAWKNDNEESVYVYDPVFGDVRTDGLYIQEDVVSASIARLLPICDILTPNQFELEYILKSRIKSERELLKRVNNHPLLSRQQVILTSALLADTPDDVVETILLRNGEIERFRVRKIPIDVVGTGDLFTAIVSAQLNLGEHIHTAIEQAMVFIADALENVHSLGLKEMDARTLLQSRDSRLQPLNTLDYL